MSGILNPKSRVMDVKLTQEGKRQLAFGDFRATYYSFSDVGVHYALDTVSGTADSSSAVHFEVCNLPQDSIVFEADDSGKLLPFDLLELKVKAGQIISSSYQATTSTLVQGVNRVTTFLTGSEFVSTAEAMLSSQLESFQRLQLIATKNSVFDDEDFSVSPTTVEFPIFNNKPIKQTRPVNIDDMDSLFFDSRFSNVKNFAYLPPMNKIIDESVDKTDIPSLTKYKLGDYKPWGRTAGVSYNQLRAELIYFQKQGYRKVLTIEPTSKNNTVVSQFFELSRDKLTKLDVIDFGKHQTGNAAHPLAHVFFVGKIRIDSTNSHTFVHQFTLIFD